MNTQVDPLLPNNYYVLRSGTEFKVLYMDGVTAAAWSSQGWEMRCRETNEQAQLEMAAWKAGKSQIGMMRSLSQPKSRMPSAV